MISKITPEHIESTIDHEVYILPGDRSDSTLTVCILTLKNGFDVVGQSACCSPDIYDEGKGKEIARLDAIRQIWPLEGYLLKQEMMYAAEAEAELKAATCEDHEENEAKSEDENETVESEKAEELPDTETEEIKPEAAESTEEHVINEVISEPEPVAVNPEPAHVGVGTMRAASQ